MNKIALFTLVSFVLLACIPLVAAQETGNMLTDTLSGVGSWISGLTSQASAFVSEQPVATGVIGTTGGIASIAGIGWKVASSAKSKLQSAYNGLKSQLDGAESKASQATEQLTTYKSQVEAQLAGVQTEAQKQIEAAKSATGQLSGLTDKIAEKDGIIGSLRNQVAEKEELYKKLLAQYEERCRITAVP